MVMDQMRPRSNTRLVEQRLLAPRRGTLFRGRQRDVFPSISPSGCCAILLPADTATARERPDALLADISVPVSLVALSIEVID